MIGLLWTASVETRYFLRRYMPSNRLLDLIRTRHLETLHERNRSVQTVLRNGIDRGQLPADLDVRLGTIAVVSFMHGLIANWVLTPDLFDIKRDAPALIEGLLQMLKSGLGRTPP